MNEFWIDPDERIEYYLNYRSSIELNLNELRELNQLNDWSRNEVKYVSYRDFKHTFTRWYCQYLMPLPLIRDIRALPNFKNYRNLHSLIDFFQPFYSLDSTIENVKFPVFYGESASTGSVPIMRKARSISDPYGILYDMRSLRYNTPCETVEKTDTSWSKKEHQVIWRGATTGHNTREDFVKNYFDKFDIGFSTVKQKPHLSSFLKKRASIPNQLKAKFIVSLQGNDLASNIRWVLFSNSVLVMPKAKWTSWTMEEKLEPYVHYLPLNDDLSNLDELLEWAKDNDDICAEIGQNGKHYVTQFLDEKYNTQVRMNFLKEFASRLKIIE